MNASQVLEVPCNNCMGCKLERSRQWSLRMMHEARYHSQNCFITLTYSDEEVPQDYGLNLRHLQLFFKRLRKSLTPWHKLPRKAHMRHIRDYWRHHTVRIRFFACGEYGDLNGRPHYHAVVFNYDWPDKVFHSVSQSGEQIYTSETLRKLWGHGHVSTQDVTRKSCAYVARYVTKKISSGDAFGFDRYYRASPVDGCSYSVRPEFAVMSRREGIGARFARDFKRDFYPSGFLVVDGVPQAPPAFYVQQLTEKEQRRLKLAAVRHGLKHKAHNTMERRMARAAVRDARIQKLQRKL